MDFYGIGKKIISIFKNPDKQKREKQPEEDFIAYAKASLNETFYPQKLTQLAGIKPTSVYFSQLRCLYIQVWGLQIFSS